MAKKKRPDSGPTNSQAGRSEPGKEVRPGELPPTESDDGGAMPMGLPIPLEHYEALQEIAKRRKPAPHGHAQEDPGAEH